MLFCAFAKCTSLREVSGAMLGLSGKTKHFQLDHIPKKSTLGDANQRRDAANYVGGLRDHGAAVVLLDTEGEYTTINEPTDNAVMIELLRERGIVHSGMQDTHVYYLAGREPSNPKHPESRQRSEYCYNNIP